MMAWARHVPLVAAFAMAAATVVFAALIPAGVSGIDRQPNPDYRARRVALAQQTKGGIVLMFGSTEPEGPNALWAFRQEDNFFYLTGWAQPGAGLIIAPAIAAQDGRPAREYQEILFLPGHNLAQEQWTGPKLGAENPRAREITGVDRVEVLDRMRDELVRLLPTPRATVYSDIPLPTERSNATAPLAWLARANAFPNYISFVDVKPLLARMRMVKDAGEIERIRHASEASVAAHLAAMRAVKPGVREREIAALMVHELQNRGCEGPSSQPIVGSGFNSTVVHYLEDSGTIGAGEVVLIDVAGEYGGYASDVTRTVPADGKFTPRQRELYDVVLGAQQAVIDAFRPGVYGMHTLAQPSLYKFAYDYINTHGKDLHGQPLGKYFIHSLSHHIGLSVHDVGDAYLPVDKGMVFSLEPGIYLPEERIGIRIEDTMWVDPAGKLVRLTEGLPRTAEEVERAMAGRQGTR